MKIIWIAIAATCMTLAPYLVISATVPEAAEQWTISGLSPIGEATDYKVSGIFGELAPNSFGLSSVLLAKAGGGSSGNTSGNKTTTTQKPGGMTETTTCSAKGNCITSMQTCGPTGKCAGTTYPSDNQGRPLR